MDNTQYLKDLAEAEKRNKQIELEQTRVAALKQLEDEKAKTLPTFQKQRESASNQSIIGAKNFAEFLANRGQTSHGIATQAELSRNNVLNRTTGEINTNESDYLTTYGNNVNNTNTNYANELIKARNTIDQDLATNLYNERVRQAETKRSSGSSGNGITKIANVPINYQRDVTGVSNGNKVTYNLPDGKGGIVQATFDKGTNPFTGSVNKDLLGTDGKYDASKAFSNGYQPKYIGSTPLSKSGNTLSVNGKDQNVWTTGSKYYVWDGTSNKYVQVKEENGNWVVK
jgi:hypothetical protein